MLAMTGEPEQFSHDQLGPFAAAGPRDGGPEGLEASHQVGPVDRIAGHSIADGPVGEVFAGILAARRVE